MTRYLPLLGLEAVSPIFTPLVAKRVGVIFYQGCGNVGDRLIETATEYLLEAFRINYQIVDPVEKMDFDVLLVGSGGNYGHPYCAVEKDRRAAALATGLPCILLPQTVYGVEVHPRPWHAAYVRDAISARLLRGSKVAPDVTFCYAPPCDVPAADADVCVSVSSLPEGLFSGFGPDLRLIFTDPDEYLVHVGRHRRVVTDSLHVAVCGLMARRKVTLLPTRLHKNRSIWETWLFRLGCGWSEDASDAVNASE
jgi:exopolysaccharide biosynthesis predicted pyruvyltransferase EpsI